jgi:hypothetical protein
VIWVMKCLATLCLPVTFPARSPILPAPLHLPVPAAAVIFSRSFSVAASSAARLRARSAARTGLWQQISRSPG